MLVLEILLRVAVLRMVRLPSSLSSAVVVLRIHFDFCCYAVGAHSQHASLIVACALQRFCREWWNLFDLLVSALCLVSVAMYSSPSGASHTVRDMCARDCESTSLCSLIET